MASKKILYTATSDIHIKTFHIPYLKWMKAEGIEVHLVVENRGNVDLSFCDRVYYVPFKRSPFDFENLKAYKKLKLIIDTQYFDVIHCHTPVVSILTRLAAVNSRKKGTKIIYTAHGYHFFKEGSIKNWLIYYPIELFFSKLTDCIVTINQEDHLLTVNKLLSTDSFMINGIGVDTSKFKELDACNKLQFRKTLELQKTDFVLTYVADFIPRKNHKFLIMNLSQLRERIPELKVLLVGMGLILKEMKALALEQKVHDIISFLGWRDDVNNILSISDLAVSTSKQEGLGLGLAEAMLCGVPVVATQDRGHRELIDHDFNGYLFPQNDSVAFVEYIVKLYEHEEIRERFVLNGRSKMQDFTIDKSLSSMGDIYNKYL